MIGNSILIPNLAGHIMTGAWQPDKSGPGCRQSGERSTARGLGLVYQRLAAEMQRLKASGAERLLDSLLQTMAMNRDLEPEELREVHFVHACWSV